MLRLLAFLLLLPTALLAQGAPRTILVLDGSGSMWGQIDGVNKIVIARQVMVDLLATLPAEQELGLMSYGHRRKGDCSDIELMIAPGTDRLAIAEAVQAISPKGKTPLSAAVIQAAEALRYTEEMATVILVSDGIETCDMDPCEVGRQLEETGVGFTAHVIGFDVAADPAAQAQLKCLAEETGGLYRDAANADELAGALEEVVVAEPEPVESRISFQAIDGDGGPVIRDGLAWSIETAEGAQLTGDPGPEPELMLADTTGTASVIRLADEAVAEASFTVPFEGGPQTIVLTLPAFLPAATLDAPDTAPVGSEITVGWTGPDQTHDKILIVAAPGTDEPHQDYAFTSDGSPATLRAQVTPGTYEIRYVMNAGNKVLATQAITLTEVTAALDAPDTLPVGTELSVGWTGPDAERDYIAIVPAGEDYRERITYAYTGNGNPARFAAPVEAGAYDLVYVLNANGTRELTRRPITLTEVSATLDVPATAPAGSEITVAFTGPLEDRDSVILTNPDEGPTQAYEHVSAAARKGSPLTMRLPNETGTYEVRYLLGGRHGEILARALVEATAVTATLTAPASVPVASDFEVGFTGPTEDQDSVILTAPEEPRGQPKEFDTALPRDGSPLELTMPLIPGTYELRYMLGGRHGQILDRVSIEATPASASIDGPATALANDKISVAFTGPAEKLDMISIASAGSRVSEYEKSARASDGSPVRLTVPLEPGAYVLRYMLGGQYGEVLAEQPITVTLPVASLTAPTAPVAAGADFTVAFTGPAFANDLIEIVLPGGDARETVRVVQATNGNPATLRAPDEPGSYELLYTLGGKYGPVLARVAFTVTAP